MTYIFTPLATDNFHRADGALGANWSQDDFGSPLPAVLSDMAVDEIGGSVGYYTGASPAPNDQYAAITVGHFDPTGVTWDEAGVYIRTSLSYSSYFSAYIAPSGDNTTCLVRVDITGAEVWNGNIGVVNSGDVLLVAAIGTTLIVNYNGVTVFTIVNTTATAGDFGMVLVSNEAPTNIQITKFECGSVALPPPDYGTPGVYNSPWNFCSGVQNRTPERS
jgi:hypothetical protein